MRKTKNTYYRPITHENYPNKKFKEQFPKTFHYVKKEIITSKFWNISQKEMDDDSSSFYHVDDEYMCQHSSTKLAPLTWGGIMLLSLIIFLWGDIYDWPTGKIVLTTISSLGLLLSIIYYFTMPKNEKIYNRKDGTITFDNFLWRKDVTMPFKNIYFAFSTGGEDGSGAYILQLVRPKNHTFVHIIFGNDCYESISGITWYMDKNRPLPPGSAFDPFRDKDFERRKAEGFPPPLYPSPVSTPEATAAQQTEREKYWRDLDYIKY